MQSTMPRVERAESDVGGEAARLWWLMVLLGLVSLAAGVILVAKPSHSLATLSVVFGIFLLIDGVVELVSSFRREEGNKALAAIVGVLGIVIGIILIRHPTHAVNAVGLVIGIWLVAAGSVRLVRAVVEWVRPVVRSAIAALEIVVGIAVISDPHIGYATLAVLVGIWLILNALAMVGLGLMLRAAKSELPVHTTT
jgi:uncharacterized membrane protein HdeD (DUF308 family)